MSDLDELCAHLHRGLVDRAREQAGFSASELAAYSDGAEHMLEMIRLGGPAVQTVLGQMLAALGLQPLGYLAGFQFEGRWAISSEYGSLYPGRAAAQHVVDEYSVDSNQELTRWHLLEVRKAPDNA